MNCKYIEELASALDFESEATAQWPTYEILSVLTITAAKAAMDQ